MGTSVVLFAWRFVTELVVALGIGFESRITTFFLEITLIVRACSVKCYTFRSRLAEHMAFLERFPYRITVALCRNAFLIGAKATCSASDSRGPFGIETVGVQFARSLLAVLSACTNYRIVVSFDINMRTNTALPYWWSIPSSQRAK